MINSSNNKLNLPAVKVPPIRGKTSVTRHKLKLTLDKKCKNKIDDEWQQEYYIIYNSYENKDMIN